MIRLGYLTVVVTTLIPRSCLAQVQPNAINCRPAHQCSVAQCDPVPPQWAEGYAQRTKYPIICEGKLAKPLATGNLSARIKRLEENINQTKEDNERQHVVQSKLQEKKISELERRMQQTTLNDAKIEMIKARFRAERYARDQTEKVRRNITNEIKNQGEMFDKTSEKKFTEAEDTLGVRLPEELDELRGEIVEDMTALEERIRTLVATSLSEAISDSPLEQPISTTIGSTESLSDSPSTAPSTQAGPGRQGGDKLKCYQYLLAQATGMSQIQNYKAVEECDEGWECGIFEFTGSYASNPSATSQLRAGSCVADCGDEDCRTSNIALAWYRFDREEIDLGDELKSCKAYCCSTDLCNG